MALTAWLIAALAIAAYFKERYRRKSQRGEPMFAFRPWPLPSIPLEELDSVFAAGPHGPTLATEVHFVGRGPVSVPGGTSDGEAWILAVLAKHAQTCFEIGTCTGKTAYLWSRNAPDTARIVTLTLAPTQRDEYSVAPGDDKTDVKFALVESDFTDFLYSGTPAAERIEQLYGDSKQFDESPYRDWADLVFVDGSHAESYVLSDSEKALRIVKPGGLVLWHDYAGPRHAPGVFRALNSLVQTIPLQHVKGTTFAAYRKPSTEY
ncbi:MAG: class I SAM-dependent methyltransferase [Gemmatimonas sp.]